MSNSGVSQARAGDLAPGAARRRDPYWDNVRFCGIALVVVGHVVTNFDDSAVMAALYVVIYAFHMPLLAFVSGYFAKPAPVTAETAFSTVRQLVVPYVGFAVVWWVVRLLVDGRARLDLASPFSLTWFLLALAVWRASLPYLGSLRHPVLISLAISLLAGYQGSIGSAFDSGKVLGMLPFFVLGWAARDRGWTARPAWQQLATIPARIVCGVVLVAALALAYFGGPSIRHLHLAKWTRMAGNYEALGNDSWWAGGERLVLFAVAVLLSVCVLVLVPRRRTVLTGWGSRTMYVYLLHFFPVYILHRTTSVEDRINSLPEFAVVVLLALGWAVVLATAPVQRVFRPLIEPRLEWLRASPRRSPVVVGSSPSPGDGAPALSTGRTA